jgi:hypothetical protein
MPLGDASVCSEKMAAPGKRSFCDLEYHTSKSVITVWRAFRAKYGNDPPTDKTIRAWYKQFTETGCLCKQKSSGCPLTAEDDVERVRSIFLHSPMKSTGTAAKELSMSKTTVWVVMGHLGPSQGQCPGAQSGGVRILRPPKKGPRVSCPFLIF